MIYWLVSTHTVEEKILEAAKKKLLMEHLLVRKMDKVQEDKKMKSNEIERILKFGTQKLFAEEGEDGGKEYEYDDEKVAKLLDRDGQSMAYGGTAIVESSENQIDDYLDKFKVAFFESKQTLPEPEEEINKTPEISWEDLLGKEREEIRREEEEKLGKGKRARKTVRYNDGLILDDTDSDFLIDDGEDSSGEEEKELIDLTPEKDENAAKDGIIRKIKKIKKKPANGPIFCKFLIIINSGDCGTKEELYWRSTNGWIASSIRRCTACTSRPTPVASVESRRAPSFYSPASIASADDVLRSYEQYKYFISSNK